ncbi:hypothetical protein DFS34DRAFT_635783 [Phlyctochytrium arcticum]|nr:hypothetical protein DFS34DRAFT_635783 [Phlyctochytrium arcticum]
MLRSTAAVTAVAPYHQMCQFRSKPMQNLDSTEELPTAADLRASSPQKNEASDAELPPTPEVLLQREQEQLPEKGGASSSWGSFSWVALVDAVKKQSEAVVDVYKRDLSEFVAVVTTESAQQFDKVAQTIITGAQFELPNSEQYQDSSVTIKGGPPPLSNPSTAQSHSSLAGHTQSKQSPLFSRTTGDPTVRQDEKLDVSPGMSAQAEQMFGMFKSGFTSLISSAVEVVESTVTEVRSSVAVQSQDGPSRDEHIFTRRTTDRESLQKDPTTYTIDPSESQDPKVLNRFQQFASSFEFSAKSSEVEELHASSAPIRLMHNTLGMLNVVIQRKLP